MKSESDRLKIVHVVSGKYLDHIRELFTEYAEALNFDLCFQNFDKEFRKLPGDYASSDGCLLLALYNKEVAGCVALRKFDKCICEMKRLYVRPGFRGKDIGRRLAIAIIEQARKIGYTTMRLDTIPAMKRATALYKSLEFKKIAPYRLNPIKDALFFELNL
jgi:ribosomal protein S18 acetylase RimI-like enzyme